MRPLMSLLDTFRSWPTGPFKLDTSRRWMSGLKFRPLSGQASHRNPELLPAMAATVLVLTAVLQLAVPSRSAMPDRPRLTMAQPVEEADAAPVAPKAYPAVMAHPIFAPDRAPPPAEADNTGNLAGVEVLGTAIRGKVAAAA